MRFLGLLFWFLLGERELRSVTSPLDGYECKDLVTYVGLKEPYCQVEISKSIRTITMPNFFVLGLANVPVRSFTCSTDISLCLVHSAFNIESCCWIQGWRNTRMVNMTMDWPSGKKYFAAFLSKDFNLTIVSDAALQGPTLRERIAECAHHLDWSRVELVCQKKFAVL